VLQSQFEDYLPYLGGAAGALFVTGVAYWASRPTAEKPLFPLDAQALLLSVRNTNIYHRTVIFLQRSNLFSCKGEEFYLLLSLLLG